jgi:hypothetical protein
MLPTACAELEAKDIDGAANGSYAAALVQNPLAGPGGLEILLHKQP